MEKAIGYWTIIPASERAKVSLRCPPSSSRGLVEGDFGGTLGRNREKSSFDKLWMISRYARLSNLQVVSP
jgi:hypothetical protein